jgi:hypothetical protein
LIDFLSCLREIAIVFSSNGKDFSSLKNGGLPGNAADQCERKNFGKLSRVRISEKEDADRSSDGTAENPC